MHIVHLVPEMQQGGVETVVAALNRELVKAGHTSTVISNGGIMARQIESDGGRHITLDVCSKNPLTFLYRVSELRRLVSDLRPSVVHAHSRVPAWLAWRANRKRGLPFVTTVHGFNSISKYSEIMTKGDRVICVSNPVKAYIQQHYKTPEAKIRVIHPGLEPEAFDPDQITQERIDRVKQRYGLDGKKVVSSIGRITELKDYETFIRAFAMAFKEDPDLRGLIVGHVRKDKQEHLRHLEQLINTLDLGDTVHIATDLTDMQAVYAASTLVVSCSKKPESFGLTLIEALAMNTPVIATRHGGPLDIIQEGLNGWFFEPGSSEELARLLDRLPPLTQSVFRDQTLQRFAVNRMALQHIVVYGELLEGQ